MYNVHTYVYVCICMYRRTASCLSTLFVDIWAVHTDKLNEQIWLLITAGFAIGTVYYMGVYINFKLLIYIHKRGLVS